MYELIYTSVPHGLLPGRTGFSTVAMTIGMPPNLIGPLENLSGYNFTYSGNELPEKLNPVCCTYQKSRFGNLTLRVASRIAPNGLDYSRRNNKLAHHLLFEDDSELEKLSGRTVELFRAPGNFYADFKDEPHELASRVYHASQGAFPLPAHGWEQATHDAGWAGFIANRFLKNPEKPFFVFYPAGTAVETLLQLIAEITAVLDKETRKDFTYSTFFSKEVPMTECFLRMIPDFSPLYLTLCNLHKADSVELLKDTPLPEAAEAMPEVAIARNGLPSPVPVEEIPEEQMPVAPTRIRMRVGAEDAKPRASLPPRPEIKKTGAATQETRHSTRIFSRPRRNAPTRSYSGHSQDDDPDFDSNSRGKYIFWYVFISFILFSAVIFAAYFYFRPTIKQKTDAATETTTETGTKTATTTLTGNAQVPEKTPSATVSSTTAPQTAVPAAAVPAAETSPALPDASKAAPTPIPPLTRHEQAYLQTVLDSPQSLQNDTVLTIMLPERIAASLRMTIASAYYSPQQIDPHTVKLIPPTTDQSAPYQLQQNNDMLVISKMDSSAFAQGELRQLADHLQKISWSFAGNQTRSWIPAFAKGKLQISGNQLQYVPSPAEDALKDELKIMLGQWDCRTEAFFFNLDRWKDTYREYRKIRLRMDPASKMEPLKNEEFILECGKLSTLSSYGISLQITEWKERTLNSLADSEDPQYVSPDNIQKRILETLDKNDSLKYDDRRALKAVIQTWTTELTKLQEAQRPFLRTLRTKRMDLQLQLTKFKLDDDEKNALLVELDEHIDQNQTEDSDPVPLLERAIRYETPQSGDHL